jgi:hypothetical protein
MAEEQRLGNDLCPCLTSIGDLDLREVANLISTGVDNASLYGVGCAAHDIAMTPCVDAQDCSEDENILSTTDTPPSCDWSWCQQKWC